MALLSWHYLVFRTIIKQHWQNHNGCREQQQHCGDSEAHVNFCLKLNQPGNVLLSLPGGSFNPVPGERCSRTSALPTAGIPSSSETTQLASFSDPGGMLIWKSRNKFCGFLSLLVFISFFLPWMCRPPCNEFKVLTMDFHRSGRSASQTWFADAWGLQGESHQSTVGAWHCSPEKQQSMAPQLMINS